MQYIRQSHGTFSVIPKSIIYTVHYYNYIEKSTRLHGLWPILNVHKYSMTQYRPNNRRVKFRLMMDHKAESCITDVCFVNCQGPPWGKQEPGLNHLRTAQ